VTLGGIGPKGYAPGGKTEPGFLTRVEVHAAGGRRTATPRAATSARQGVSNGLPDFPASRGAALLPSRADEVAWTPTLVRSPG